MAATEHGGSSCQAWGSPRHLARRGIDEASATHIPGCGICQPVRKIRRPRHRRPTAANAPTVTARYDDHHRSGDTARAQAHAAGHVLLHALRIDDHASAQGSVDKEGLYVPKIISTAAVPGTKTMTSPFAQLIAEHACLEPPPEDDRALKTPQPPMFAVLRTDDPPVRAELSTKRQSVWPSEAIRGHQRPSEAIRGHQWTHLPSLRAGIECLPRGAATSYIPARAARAARTARARAITRDRTRPRRCQ